MSNVSNDRGTERYRRAGLTASTSLVSQSLSILTALISIPLTIRYLGQERYGVWLTISSILTWLTMTDFGLTGTALINVLADANGRDDKHMARQYASSAFCALIMLMFAMGLVFVILFSRVPWNALFHVSSRVSASEIRNACGLALAIFLFSYPLYMLNSLYSAYQDGFVANIWTIVSNLIALIALVGVTRFEGGLPLLVFAVSGIRVLVGFVNAYHVYVHRYPWLVPSVRAVRWKYMKRLFLLGGKYFVSQAASLGIGQSHPLIITRVLGPAAVPLFVIPLRLITLPQSLIYMATFPLVSAYSEAKSRNDWEWIRGAFKRSVLWSLGFGFALTVLVAAIARPVIRIWAGATTTPSTPLLLALTGYGIISIATIPPGQVLSGMERIGVQATALVICALSSVILGIVFIKLWGLSGLALAMSLSSLVTLCSAQFYEIRRTFRLFDSVPARASRAHTESVAV